MQVNQICGKCGTRLKTMTIAMSWPGKIRCSQCRTDHHYRFSVLIGIAYFTLVILVALPIRALAELFPSVQDGVYTTSFLQTGIVLSSPFVAIAIIGPIYVRLMARFCHLRRNDQ